MTTANAIQHALDQLYRAHVGPGDPYALVDFPDHANVGDSAIWLGEIAMLRGITGHEPAYVSTWHDFDAEAFRRACPTGTLFLHGGGNLGDIWPHHQQFREHILATVRDRAVVQLPQSIHFRNPDGVARFAGLATEHPDFTLYVRDRPSLDFASARLSCPTHLAPDSAFALGHQSRAPADCDVLMLLRTDDERRDHATMPSAGNTMVDWLEDDPDLPRAFTSQARARVDRGLRLLSRGRVIVTDRLHGHILADLLGIPHVVLDNDYGKIAAYLAAWAGSERVPAIRATTMAEAERAAAQLA